MRNGCSGKSAVINFSSRASVVGGGVVDGVSGRCGPFGSVAGCSWCGLARVARVLVRAGAVHASMSSSGGSTGGVGSTHGE